MALMRTFVSRTNRTLFFIKEGLQNLGSQPALLRLLANLLHDGIERFSTLGHLVKSDAEEDLEFSAIFFRQRSESSRGLSVHDPILYQRTRQYQMVTYAPNSVLNAHWLLF